MLIMLHLKLSFGIAICQYSKRDKYYTIKIF